MVLVVRCELDFLGRDRVGGRDGGGHGHNA